MDIKTENIVYGSNNPILKVVQIAKGFFKGKKNMKESVKKYEDFLEEEMKKDKEYSDDMFDDLKKFVNGYEYDKQNNIDTNK